MSCNCSWPVSSNGKCTDCTFFLTANSTNASHASLLLTETPGPGPECTTSLELSLAPTSISSTKWFHTKWLTNIDVGCFCLNEEPVFSMLVEPICFYFMLLQFTWWIRKCLSSINLLSMFCVWYWGKLYHTDEACAKPYFGSGITSHIMFWVK